ncbi:hypothetical protein ACFX2J_035195 [Malus domestica]
MNCAEKYVKFLCKSVLKECKEDMQFMAEKYVKSCVGRLEIVRSTPFKRVTYTEAVDLLVEAVKDGKKFENHILDEENFKQPVIVYNYPKKTKAFYRLNEDGETVFAMDVVVPKVGWLIGGSPREECYGVLKERILEMERHVEDYQSYLDLRRFGAIKHSGFDLGFERMVMFATGLDNIRDCISYPRDRGREDP